MAATTYPATASVREATLYVALELGAREWTVAMTSAVASRPWLQKVPAGDLARLLRLVAAGRRRFGLAASAPVVSCYEAGRDGFWVHHALAAAGIANRVVDSASIEVNRRARRAKTDRLDALKLVRMLVRVCSGEVGVWREPRVPTVEMEAARHVSRERSQLVAEQTRITNQLRSWLALHGARLPRRRADAWWEAVRDWAGQALPATLQARLARAEARLQVVAQQLAAIAATQRATLCAAPAASAAHRLVQLKGIATTSTSVLLDEGLVWRDFQNRREVGGLLGFTPVPYRSGVQARDQGIDRAGNSRLRGVSIQLAWGWLRWQPSSALAQWYQARFGGRGARARRIGIVALARKLLIALWRWACQGILPDGAVLKAA